jgi:ribosomal protein S18 acetylase RimI-like enzyme
VLGVHPDHQGRGFGSHLMRPVLERCDSERIPAYLETDSERNVTLYERHGFRTRSKENLPGGGPPVWFMWREPQ